MSAAGNFDSTHWSAVFAAAETGNPDAGDAMAFLCRAYWYPLYAWLRRNGASPHDAEDLLQEFYSRQVLTRAVLSNVHPRNGRFRAWLIASLRHFASNERDRSRAVKRGGAQTPLSITGAEERFANVAATMTSPDAIFERSWAQILVREATEKLRAAFLERGSSERFAALSAFLPGAQTPLSLDELASKLGVSTNAAKVALHRFRRDFADALRAEVARTVSSPAEIEEELRELVAALRT